MELPGNSQNARATPENNTPKVEAVVSGEVIRRKPKLGKRIMGTFFGDSAKNVAAYVLTDVILPAVKDLIVDAGQEAIQRAIFGESGGRRSSRFSRPSGPSGYISYNRTSSPTNRTEHRPTISPRGREQHNFEEIEFKSRADAEEVRRSMLDRLAKYEMVSVADFLSLAGITPAYTDEKYGWTDLRGTDISRERGGSYVLLLPPTEQFAR